MEAPTEDDLNVLRGFLGTMVSAKVLGKFDIGDLTLLWSNKYRDEDDLRTATRDQLTKIGLPGALIDHIIRGAAAGGPSAAGILAGPRTAKTRRAEEIVRRASAVANDVVVLGQKRPIGELFELGWHHRLLPTELPLSHDKRYQLLPGQDKVTTCLERDWFGGVYDGIVKQMDDPNAQRWMEIAGPSGIGKSNGLVSIADRLLIWAAQQRKAGRHIRIFPLLNGQSLKSEKTWAPAVHAALGAGFHDDEEALARIPELDSEAAVSDFVQAETEQACWLVDQAQDIFQDAETRAGVELMTSLRHALFISSGGGRRASDMHARHVDVHPLAIPTAISKDDIRNWDLRYQVPFKSGTAVRQLDMLGGNLLLRYTFWQSCEQVGVQLPPLSDAIMKTCVSNSERPSKRVRISLKPPPPPATAPEPPSAPMPPSPGALVVPSQPPLPAAIPPQQPGPRPHLGPPPTSFPVTSQSVPPTPPLGPPQGVVVRDHELNVRSGEGAEGNPEEPALELGAEEATGHGAVVTGGASGSSGEEPVSFGAAWAHFLNSGPVQALFTDVRGYFVRHQDDPQKLRYFTEKCKELALSTTWVEFRPGVYSGRDFIFQHTGSEMVLRARAASDIVRFALAQAAESAIPGGLAFTGCLEQLLGELRNPNPHPALVGILAERVVGERLQQGAAQAYFHVKPQKLRVRKYKQDRVKELAGSLIRNAAEVLTRAVQHVTLAVPDEFNARDTDYHVIVIEKEGMQKQKEEKGGAKGKKEKKGAKKEEEEEAIEKGAKQEEEKKNGARFTAGLIMHVHGIQVTTSDLLRHAHSEDHAMHPQRAHLWRADLLDEEQVTFSFLFVAPEKRLGRHQISEEVPPGQRTLRNGAKVTQVAHQQVLLSFSAFDEELAELDKWPQAWVDSVEGTWAVTDEVKKMRVPKRSEAGSDS